MTKLEKIILCVAVLIFLVAVGVAIALADAPTQFKPNELQELRLQLKQRDAQLAQKDLFIAQQNFSAAIEALNGEGEKVKAENNWPTSVIFNKEKLTFTAAAAPQIPPKSDPEHGRNAQ